MGTQPIKRNVEPAVNHMRKPNVPDLLLRHCQTLGGVEHVRPSARARLEEALGPELTERLLRSLMPVSGSRR